MSTQKYKIPNYFSTFLIEYNHWIVLIWELTLIKPWFRWCNIIHINSSRNRIYRLALSKSLHLASFQSTFIVSNSEQTNSALIIRLQYTESHVRNSDLQSLYNGKCYFSIWWNRIATTQLETMAIHSVRKTFFFTLSLDSVTGGIG